MLHSELYPAPPLRRALLGVTLQGAAIFICVSALFVRSNLLPWLGVACIASSLFFQWATWVLGHYGAARTPVFGDNSPVADDAALLKPVVLIAAARNEEAAIEVAVRSMTAQDYPSLEAVLVDDHSTDATFRILETLAAKLPNLHVRHAPPIEPGWMGKQNALWSAAQEAGDDRAWLLFTDADIVFGPALLRDAVIYAEKNHVDLLTCIPWLETGSVLEELLLGAQWTAHFAYATPKRLDDPAARPFGIGAFMLVRRSLYFQSGGHAAIANCPLDDTALAALVKKAGGRVGFGRVGHELRCRQYNGLFDAIRAQMRKQRLTHNDRILGILSVVESQLMQWVLPLPLAAGAVAAQVYQGAFSWGLTAFTIAALVLYLQGALLLSVARLVCRMRPATLLLGPVLGLMRTFIGMAALWGTLRKAPLEWRARAIPPRQ